jgi:hypothetical protein
MSRKSRRPAAFRTFSPRLKVLEERVVLSGLTLTLPSGQFSSEGQTASVQVSATDPPGNMLGGSDGDGGGGGGGTSLTYSASGLPAGLSINASSGLIGGVVAYNNAASGLTVSLEPTVAVTDGTHTTSGAFAWAVADTDRLPTAGVQADLTGEAATLAMHATDNTGTNSLTYSVSGLPGGLSINSSTGLIGGTLAPSDAPAGGVSSYYPVVTLNDNHGGTDYRSLTWFVSDPVAAWTLDYEPNPTLDLPPGATLTEGVGYSAAVGGSGVSSAALTFTAVGLPEGLGINASTGLISGEPAFPAAEVFGGTYAVDVILVDGLGGNAEGTLTLAVKPAPPTLENPGGQYNAPGDGVDLQVNASDGDGYALTYAAGGLPAGLSIDPDAGDISGIIDPSAGRAAAYTVAVSVSDGEGNTVGTTFGWEVGVTAQGPQLTGPGDQSNAVGDVVDVTPTGGAANGVLTWTASNLPAGLTIDPGTGEVTGTIGLTGAGTHTVTLRGSDGQSQTSQTFLWTVAGVSLGQPADQGSVVGDAVSLSVAGADASASLTYSVSGLPGGLSINSSTGLISGTVAAGAAGDSTVTLTAADGSNSVSQTFDWSVAALTLAAPADQYGAEGGGVSLQLAATDVGGTAAYSASGLPAGLTLNATSGLVSGTLAAGDYVSSPYAVSVTASDGANSDTETFAWDVAARVALLNPGGQSNATGDGVSLAVTGHSAAGALGYSASGLPAGLSLNASTGLVSGTITAGAGQSTVTLTASDGTGSSSVVFGWAVAALALPAVADQDDLDGDGVSLAAAAGYHGSSAVSYSASGLPAGLGINPSTGLISGTVANDADVQGEYDVTVAATAGTLSATAEFGWEVDPRVTLDGLSDQGNVGGDSVSLAVSASDATTAALTYAAGGLPSGLGINGSTGLISGTISPGAVSGTAYAPTVTVTDGTASVSQAFNWSVAELGLAWPGTVDAVAGRTLSLGLEGRDADGGGLTYSATGLPAGLSVNASTGLVSGTPSSLGWDIVQATLREGTLSAQQTFDLDVLEVGLANPGTLSNTEGDVVSLALQGSSAGGPSLTWAAVGLPGGLSVNAGTGVIGGTVAPGAAADGPFTPTLVVSDGTASTQQALTWNVNPLVTLGGIADQGGVEGDSVSLAVPASEAGTHALSYSASGLPGGLTLNASTGLISGTLAAGDALAGGDLVSVTAAWGSYAASASFNWTILPSTAPAAPSVSNPGWQVSQTGDDVSVQVQASDSAGYTLAYSATNLPDGLSIDPSLGLISGTLADDADSNAAYPVTVTAVGGGVSSSQTFNWVVGALNFTPPDDQFNQEGDAVSLQVAASDEVGSPVYSATGLPAGLTLNPTTGLISGTIGLSDSGGSPYAVTLTAGDGSATDSETLNWNVTAEVGLLNPGGQSNAEGDSVSLALTGASGVGTLSYSLTGAPAGLGVNASTGLISGTVTAGDSATSPYWATVTAGDGTASSSVVFPWSVAVLALPQPADQDNLDGDGVTLALGASYHGAGVPSYSVSGLPAGLSLNATTGLISGTVGNSADGASPYEATVTAIAGSNTAVVSLAWEIDPRVSLVSLPDQSNVGGDSVSVALSATDATSAGLTYSASGLPSGLTINASTGLVSGTIATGAVSGTPYAVTLLAGDGSASVSQVLSWAVAAEGLSQADVREAAGQAVSLALQGRSAGGGALSYTATGLPAGLSLNGSTGLVSGTPTTLGAYLPVVTVWQGTNSATAAFAWGVLEAALQAPAGKTSTEGGVVSLALQGASAAGAPLTYSASDLPDGLTLNPSTGLISGTLIPGAAADGPYAVTATVDDGTAQDTQTFNWSVAPYVSLASIADQSGVEGSGVSLAVSATDAGSLALTYSASGLPAGLGINPSTGLISGTIATGAALAGAADVTVAASDGTYGSSESFAWSLRPAVAPAAPTVSTLGLQRNDTGDGVNVRVQAGDAAGYPLSYSATNLPDGLSIDPSLGLISGTVADDAASTKAYCVTVSVSDGVGETTNMTFTWAVNPSPVSVQANTFSALAGTPTGVITVATFTTTDQNSQPGDFTANISWGDGTSDDALITGENGVFYILQDHTYEESGTLPVMVVVTDTVTGGVGMGTGTATVPAAPWTLTGAFEQGTLVGSSAPLVLGTIQDNDPAITASDFNVTIPGIGVATVAALGDGLFSVSASHDFTTGGTDALTLNATGPGGSETATSTVAVGTLEAGVPSTLTVAQFAASDPSLPAGSYTATINWGDGSASSTGTVSLSGGQVTVTGSHTYPVDSMDQSGYAYQVTVQLSDTAGDNFSVTNPVVVVRPQVQLQVANVVEDFNGTVSNQTVAAFEVPNHTDAATEFQATINWGDGTSSVGMVTGGNGLYQVEGGHSYAIPGSYNIDVYVTQAWGGDG